MCLATVDHVLKMLEEDAGRKYVSENMEFLRVFQRQTQLVSFWYGSWILWNISLPLLRFKGENKSKMP